MRNLLTASAAALLAAGLAAQEDHFTSSPDGFSSTEGGTSMDLIGSAATLRFQQVDATNFGGKEDRNRWAFRRDGLLADNPTYGARNVELELVLAEGDLGTFSTSFASNYVSGTDTLVFTKKTIAFPDWSVAPAATPANHDLVIFLDTMWSYNGKAVTGTDLLWEVRVYSNDKAGSAYPMDADIVVPDFLSGVSSALGTSTCTASGQSGTYNEHFSILNYGTKMQLDMDVSRAAANSPAAYLLGLPQTTPLQPLFCGDLQVNPLLVIAMGNTDPTGFAAVSFDAPYSPASIGGSIAGQCIVIDAGQPNSIGLAQGRLTNVPMDPPNTSQCKHIYDTNVAATTAASGVVDGGIICMTNHP